MRHSLTFLALAATLSGAHAVLIDSFDDASLTTRSIVTGLDGFYQSGLSGIAAGDARNVAFAVFVNNHPRSAPALLDLGLGAAIYDAPTAVVGQLQLRYGYDANFQPTNPLSLDFSISERIDIKFLFNDNPTLSLQVELGSATGTSVLARPVAVGQAFAESFRIADFVGAADLDDVDTIKLVFGTAASSDFALGNVASVPEPASMAALVMAVGLLAARRRR